MKNIYFPRHFLTPMTFQQIMMKDRGTEIIWASFPLRVSGVILWKQVPGPHFESTTSEASLWMHRSNAALKNCIFNELSGCG